MPYAAGVVTVPSSTGTVSVSLPGPPAFVVFQGTNFTTEDTVLTGSGYRSIFRGSCGRAYDNPSSVYQSCVCVTADQGIQRSWRNAKAVTVLSSTTLGTTLYEASCSFSGNSFDLNFTTAAAGGYKVVYFALYANSNAVSMGPWDRNGFVNEDIGFTPSAFIAYAQRSAAGAVDETRSDEGSGLFSSASRKSNGHYAVASISTHNYPNSVGGQWYVDNTTTSDDLEVNSKFGYPARFSTFVLANAPWGFSATGNLFSAAAAGTDEFSGSVLAWDDNSECGALTPATASASTATVSGLTFAPTAALFYGVSDLPIGIDSYGNTGTRALGYMLGIKTPGFEWCACVETDPPNYVGAGTGGASYQTFSRSICSTLDGTDLHTSTVTLTSDGFVATTDDDTAAPSQVSWAALGSPSAPWMPQIYRRPILAGRG